ncbi:hypothetical protein [Fusobacterium necrophorum]|uniref:Uncharacterized protein n=2 Tax=Fusobacterium necrophorum TaxID=859 RepID=A0AB73C168_9FUSO|nr:hypothetical protein [Fusobacterium necrophorum]KDE64819.1 hypothetical protein FUSO4_07315 [Fusobacterium necrophorum DJ-1]KDE70282.1 hypothetical protein FUSO8_09540 [Fusobacterium necrophorum DJ-2]
MKVSYRFFAKLSEMRKAGFDLPDNSQYFIVQGDDIRLDKLKKLLGDEWRNYCIVNTEFTEKERHSAPYLSIRASKILGYAQPEDTYEEVNEECLPEYPYPFDVYPCFKDVYEVAATSSNYGMLRGEQIGDFKLTGEPKWGKACIGSIFDAADIFFTTPDIYEKIFKPLGIECRQVLAYGNQKPLKTVVQLVSQGIAESKLILEESLITEKYLIKEWNMTKYMLSGESFAPAFETHPGNFDFFVSQEYFGSGGINENEIFVSQRLYQLLKENKVKGVNYYPCLSASYEPQGGRNIKK